MELLPADCQCEILYRTSPADVCRLSAVSRGFKFFADSDNVWDKFLPSDLGVILSRTRSTLLCLTKKKHLCVCLIHQPLILHGGNLSLALDRESAKKCYMLGARELTIAWVTYPKHWKRTPYCGSRFGEVAIIQLLWWFEIKCKIETQILSPNTVYVALLVYKFEMENYGFISLTISVVFRTVDERGDENEMTSAVYFTLDPWKPIPENGKIPQKSNKGWLEVELGEFIVDPDNNRQLQIRLFEMQPTVLKSGLVVEGIEFRPKVIASSYNSDKSDFQSQVKIEF